MYNTPNKRNCVDCLKRSPLFNFLTQEQLELVSKNKTEIDFKAGEIIYKQGTVINDVISLNSGMAKIYIEGLNNRDMIISFLNATHFVGGPGIFVDNKHHFSIKAVEDSSACLIDGDVFKKLIKDNHEFAYAILRFISEKSIYYFNRFISLTQKQMPGRIADAILYLSTDIYKCNPFDLNISRQEIGELSAMSTESASRILNDLQKEGVIKVKGKRIEIINENLLKEISIKG